MTYLKLFLGVCSLFLFSLNAEDTPISNPAPSVQEYPKETNSLRILSYNVRHFKNANNEIEYTRIAEVIKELDADIVCLQEIDKNTNRSNQHDQMEQIASLTHMNSYFSKSIDYQGGAYGNGLLSKKKAIYSDIIPLPGKEPRSALILEFDDYVIIATHLALESNNREEAIQLISKEANKYKSKPVFLAGDLNETDLNSPFFQELRHQWNIDSADGKTYPTPSATDRLDYILSYKAVNIQSKAIQTHIVYDTERLITSTMSDHYPIFCDYQILK